MSIIQNNKTIINIEKILLKVINFISVCFLSASIFIPITYPILAIDKTFKWLRTGEWEPYKVYMLFSDMGFPIKYTGWVEIDKLLDWYASSSAYIFFIIPMCMILFIIPFIIASISSVIFHDIKPKKEH